ncbi:hypothetical protein HMPREF0202_01916 [Cetobacterium somerae ATCC BAA-474]|uniref:Uncharacterized protein n=2 Tax=Fusobacteriaceae TaxID=203492 RepID=U7V9P9_9FUSO|nr:hypothetical protein HMPREF0202_01916 [Cetobacterium somerae ATCC BAA-474]
MFIYINFKTYKKSIVKFCLNFSIKGNAMEQYNDEQRKIDLLEWFLENNFFNKRIEYYMKKFEIISKIQNINEKREEFLKFQIEILKEFDTMSNKNLRLII